MSCGSKCITFITWIRRPCSMTVITVLWPNCIIKCIDRRWGTVHDGTRLWRQKHYCEIIWFYYSVNTLSSTVPTLTLWDQGDRHTIFLLTALLKVLHLHVGGVQGCRSPFQIRQISPLRKLISRTLRWRPSPQESDQVDDSMTPCFPDPGVPSTSLRPPSQVGLHKEGSL